MMLMLMMVHFFMDNPIYTGTFTSFHEKYLVSFGQFNGYCSGMSTRIQIVCCVHFLTSATRDVSPSFELKQSIKQQGRRLSLALDGNQYKWKKTLNPKPWRRHDNGQLLRKKNVWRDMNGNVLKSHGIKKYDRRQISYTNKNESSLANNLACEPSHFDYSGKGIYERHTS